MKKFLSYVIVFILGMCTPAAKAVSIAFEEVSVFDLYYVVSMTVVGNSPSNSRCDNKTLAEEAYSLAKAMMNRRNKRG